MAVILQLLASGRRCGAGGGFRADLGTPIDDARQHNKRDGSLLLSQPSEIWAMTGAQLT